MIIVCSSTFIVKNRKSSPKTLISFVIYQKLSFHKKNYFIGQIVVTWCAMFPFDVSDNHVFHTFFHVNTLVDYCVRSSFGLLFGTEYYIYIYILKGRIFIHILKAGLKIHSRNSRFSRANPFLLWMK